MQEFVLGRDLTSKMEMIYHRHAQAAAVLCMMCILVVCISIQLGKSKLPHLQQNLHITIHLYRSCSILSMVDPYDQLPEYLALCPTTGVTSVWL